MTNSKLMPVQYTNQDCTIRLRGYADTVVFEQEQGKNILRAIRFGGYPEMVTGLADAIYGGGSVQIALPQKAIVATAPPKGMKRQLSHDGIYAEATLLAIDDIHQEDGKNQNTEESPDETNQPRKCCIFCPADHMDYLFGEVDKKTAVPLIPEFQDYLLHELIDQKFLKQLTVVSTTQNLSAWVLTCHKEDANIVKIVEDGLKSGKITIPAETKNPDGFQDVDNVTTYLNTFGVTVAERIRNQFTPLFDPSTEPLSQEVLDINDYIFEQAGYNLYHPQMAVAESVKRQLSKHKCGIIVAECGVGKTKIGTTALTAHQRKSGKKAFNLVLCPSHVAKKWVREIHETLPDTVAFVISSIAELDKMYGEFLKSDKTFYGIMSKEKARDGYMKQPAVVWHPRKRAFCCPDCGAMMEMPLTEDGVTYMVTADQRWFQTEHRKNRKCAHCNTVLWTTVNNNAPSLWNKIGGYGWVYGPQAVEHLRHTKTGSVIAKLEDMIDHPNDRLPTVGACRRYPLSTYIKNQYKGKIDGIILDELHQFSRNSGQGDAMGELFNVSKKAIGMTATLINGYSSGMFHLLYRMVPHLMVKDGQSHSKPQLFDGEYGVVENTYEVKDGQYASNRRTNKVKKRSRQLPGVSPLVFSRFLLEYAAFLTLSDIGKELPDYEEIPIALPMEQEVEDEYTLIERELRTILKSDKKAAQRILSAYLNLLTVYPDQPYDQPAVIHPLNGEAIVSPKSIGDFETLGAKEEKVLQLVQEKQAKGEKVLIYCSWTRTDTREKLQQLLSSHHISASIMTDKIRPNQREEWVSNKLSKGMDVMITNPTLVETGLDLNTFTTLIFYSMGYNLFTLRQASRRSWRINQTAPRVEVYMLYYENTMQAKAMKLMASKLAVAGIIEGSFSEEGLAAMSDVQDMTSMMAKELMLGIRDNVDDISATFKKMAMINPERQKKQEAAPKPTSVEIEQKLQAPLPPLKLQQTEVKQTVKSRKTWVLDNQLSLFDFAS